MGPVEFSFQQFHRRIPLIGLLALLSCSVFIATNRAGAPFAAARATDDMILLTDNTIRCALRKGESTFVVSSQNNAVLDRLTFINENAAASGELRIAVSDDRLSASSEKWRAVEGRIRFDHKRLFKVSLVGIEARYVKLVFQVNGEIGDRRFLAERTMTNLSVISRF